MRDFGSAGAALEPFWISTKRMRQLEEHLLEQLPLFGGEVAARLLFEQRQDVDHLLRRRQVRLRGRAADGIGDVAEMHRRGVGKRQHEGDEVDACDASWSCGNAFAWLHQLIRAKPDGSIRRGDAMAETAGTRFDRLVDDHARAARAGRLPVGPGADAGVAAPVRARRDLRGARSDRARLADALREELGDYLYEAVFLAQISEEARRTSPSPTPSTRSATSSSAAIRTSSRAGRATRRSRPTR